MRKLNHYALATILLVVLFVIPIIILSIVFKSENVWAGLPLGVAGTYEEFCERNRMDAFLRERVNSWSNLAFVWFGLIALLNSIRPKQVLSKNHLVQKNGILSVFTGLSFLYLGIGSFLYHAALTKYTQLLDVAGTYAAIVAVIAVALITLIAPYLSKANHYKKILIAVVLVCAIIADILLFKYKWEIDSAVVLPVMIVLLIMLSMAIHLSKKHKAQPILAILSFIAVATAFLIWNLDVKKIFCNPDSLLQGHAIWHILTGTGLFLMYLFCWKVEVDINI